MPANNADPIVGMWYKHFDKGEKFEVVAVDEDAKLVEIQTYGGDIDEVDLYVWYTLPIEPIESPEDEMAPMDDVEADDQDYSETSLPERWEEVAEGVKHPKEGWDESTGTDQPDADEDWNTRGDDEEP
ncbi:DUF6763 family protein [Methylomagnum sp.]